MFNLAGVSARTGVKSEKSKTAALNAYKAGKRVFGGTTKWYDYKNIRVQGTYELRACKILDHLKSIGDITAWEYTRDRITYTKECGQISTYLLDFKVWRGDQASYIETKGYIR